MKLKELLMVFDNETEIQICKKDDWEDYDTLKTGSDLLRLVEDKMVRCVEAMDLDVIRVDLRWDEEE